VFVGQHGSWNRRPPSGYRVIFVPFANGRRPGPVEEVLTGFLDATETRAGAGRRGGRGRGALLVADDVGNAVWRWSRTPRRWPRSQRLTSRLLPRAIRCLTTRRRRAVLRTLLLPFEQALLPRWKARAC
jgi:hypothetical protein